MPDTYHLAAEDLRQRLIRLESSEKNAFVEHIREMAASNVVRNSQAEVRALREAMEAQGKALSGEISGMKWFIGGAFTLLIPIEFLPGTGGLPHG
ncbi:MAG: hypothetical protein OXM02_12025 [Bacteroidota bacterium]|nr:hypothetical protein [Bacteroidota bacterium]MDE2957664.1 hypothetical protein [Bacteroidota bacterium]